MSNRKGFSIRNLSKTECEVCIYDPITRWGGVSATELRREVKAAGEEIKTIHLHINSPGGEVWEGMAMHSFLSDHSAKVVVHIDGVAASMASVIAMAGDEIVMPPNAFLMIHDPTDCVCGDSNEMRKTAELLDQVTEQIVGIYSRRSGQPVEKIAEMMSEDSWIPGEECLSLGFCDRCTEPLATAAFHDPSQLSAYKNVPKVLLENRPADGDDLVPVIFANGAELKFLLANHNQPVTQPQGAEPMATQPEPAKPAMIKELRAACPGATEKFLCDQLEAEATVATASAAWQAEQANRIKELEDKLKAAQTETPGNELPKPNGKKKGNSVDDAGDADDDEPDLEDAINSFDTLVTKEVTQQVALGQRADRMKAVVKVANKHPELHQAYLSACNGGGKRVKRIIDEKYDVMPSSKK